jgi:type I restriction enzyme M protein
VVSGAVVYPATGAREAVHLASSLWSPVPRCSPAQRSGWLPHTNLLRLRVIQTAGLNPAYLLAYLSQAAVQARIRDRSVQSVTTSLSTAALGGLEIPLPPLTDQQRILSALQSLDEQTTAIEQRLSAARAARTALARHLTDGTVILTGGETGE